MLPVFVRLIQTLPAITQSLSTLIRNRSKIEKLKTTATSSGSRRSMIGAVGGGVTRSIATFAAYEALGMLSNEAFSILAEHLSNEELDILNESLESIPGFQEIVPVFGWLLADGIVYSVEKGARRFKLATTKNGKSWFGKDDVSDADLFRSSIVEYDTNNVAIRTYDINSSVSLKKDITLTRSAVGFERHLPRANDLGFKSSRLQWILFTLLGASIVVARIADELGFPLLGKADERPTIEENTDIEAVVTTPQLALVDGKNVWNSNDKLIWLGQEVDVSTMHKILLARYADELASVEVLAPANSTATRLANKGATLRVLINAIDRLENGNVRNYLDVVMLVLEQPGEAYETYLSISRAIANSK